MSQTGFTPILIYGSTTTGNTPSASNLTTSSNGIELAINATDGKLFYKDNGGTVQVLATKGTGSIGGANTQVQYNSSGALAGSANLTFNGTTLTANTLNLTNVLGTGYGGTGLTSFTANGVVYASSTSALATGSALAFDGTNLINTSSSIGTPEIAIANSATSSGANARLRIKTGASGATTYGDAYVQFTDGINFNWSIGSGSSTSNNLVFTKYFGLTSNEYMRLTSAGYLGIGTSSPSAYLHVVGSKVIFQAAGPSQGAVQFGTTDTTHFIQAGNDYLGMNISSVGSGNTGINFITGTSGSGTTNMILDASGNLGLGVTPSAWWNQYHALQVGGAAYTALSLSGSNANNTIYFNSYQSSSAETYVNNGYANKLQVSNGQFQFSVASSGSAGGTISFGNPVMTLDNSGNLLVGTTSATGTISVQGAFSNTNTSTPYLNSIFSMVNSDRTTNNLTALYFSGKTSVGSVQGLGTITMQTTSYTDNAFTSNMLFYTSNSGSVAERMRIDNNGNLGLGVTPSAWNTSYKALEFPNGTGVMAYSGGSNIPDFHIFENAYLNTLGNWVYKNSGYKASRIDFNNGSVVFAQSTDATQTAGSTITFASNMTLDNSGNLLVGANAGSVTGTQQGLSVSPSNGFTVASHANGTASGTAYIYFNYNAGTIGSITQSGTTAVLYNTTSDYRLKSNVQPVTTGLSIINQLNPVNFTWISDNEADTGFLAHEFQSVIPRSVTGEKDATKTEEYEVTPAVKDENGNVTTPAVMGTRTVPVYQQMDNSGAVPYLVAAIKELSAKVTALQSQVAALTPKS